ncbi:hypothetical protein ACFXJ8_18135 [Nonomuraea sp. NPDC059194]|uniref:hypothetical protein n=1 Tax=Nonomuraea sp. NPDC059194 TaxID=3346764 RepID=UPI003677A428
MLVEDVDDDAAVVAAVDRGAESSHGVAAHPPAEDDLYVGWAMDEHTALGGPGTGWDLHEFCHSALTHLGEAGASPLMLMAKSRHKKPENLRRCFKPTPDAIAEIASLLALA